MFVFNTLEIDKKYTEADIKGMAKLSEYGLDNDFYGGRCFAIGKTNSDVLLILENLNGLRVIDTAAVKLENIHIKFIKELAKKRKIKLDPKLTKEDLIALLS